MIGDKSFFINLIHSNDRSVTSGDENNALICGKGSISALEILELKYVLYVEDIKANLISIR